MAGSVRRQVHVIQGGRTFRTTLRRLAWPMFRDLLICVVLPSLLLLSAEVAAQQTAAVPAQVRSDDQLADQINSKLMASNTLRPLDLGVWVHDGTVTLSGTVPTATLRQQADTLVRTVRGVKKIDDQMTVGAVMATAPGFPAASATPSVHAGGSVPAVSSPTGSPVSGGNGSNSTIYAGRSPQENYPGQNGVPAQNQQQSAPTRMYRTRAPLLTIAAGTPLYVMMMQTVDSHHTKPGMGFHGLLARDIVLRNGVIALPRGAYVEGTVIDARPPGHLKGRPQLALQLSNITIGNTSYVLTSSMWAHRGPGKGGETAQAVGGGATFGAITGAIVGGGPVALLGAAIGALGGAGLSALSSGPHLVVPAESIVNFRLNAPLTVRELTAAQVRMVAANLPECGNCRPRRRRYYSSYPASVPGAPPGGYPY